MSEVSRSDTLLDEAGRAPTGRRAAPRPRPPRGSRGSAPRTSRARRRRSSRRSRAPGCRRRAAGSSSPGPPQRWQTAWSLSTNSARARSSGIGPNGRRRKSWSSPAAITRAPPSASASAASTIDGSKNCASSIPTTSHPRARATSSAAAVDRHGGHADAGVADHVVRVVAVVDSGLEDDHALARRSRRAAADGSSPRSCR